jgi:hypothetical protein
MTRGKFTDGSVAFIGRPSPGIVAGRIMLRGVSK